MNNGDTDPKQTVISEVLDVLSDHVEILSLEWRYESRQAARRLAAVGIALVLSFTAFLLLQVALVYGLMAAGLNAGWASLLLAAIYMIAGAFAWQIFGRRDIRAGRPFEATRRQLPESKQWIQKLFS